MPELVLARIARVSRDGVLVARAGRIEWANPALAELFAREPESLVGARLAELRVTVLDPSAGDPPAPLDLGALCSDSPPPVTATVHREDGNTVAVSIDAVALDATATDQWVITFRGISRLVRADEELRASEAQFRALAANAPIGVFQSEHGTRLGYLNRHFAEVWGRPAEELQGTGWLDGIHHDDLPDVVAVLADTLAGKQGTTTFRVQRGREDLRLVEARVVPVTRGDRSIGFVGSIEDVTDARRHEEVLEWQATHDPLTGLANRTELLRQINRELTAARGSVGVIFLDLDDFKVVNDSLGHSAGDVLLQTIGERLRRLAGPDNLVARFGGDEFVIVCRHQCDEATVMELGRRILIELDRPVSAGSRSVRLTASVGVVLASTGTADGLLRDADIAMYQAKNAGKARIAAFDERARTRVQQHHEIMNGVRQVLATGSVPVAYQPVVATSDLRIVGAEALLRYEHPTQGPIPALEVISLAEATGTIGELGANVMSSACQALATWRQTRSSAPDYVAVNLAAAQLAEVDLVPKVLELLASWSLTPRDLCIELTESQLMADAEQASQALADLHATGIRIAIDDFGTGYSSLAYLRRFPADVVKLDRSFIADVTTDRATAAIVQAVVSLSDALGLAVAAEGVETADQLRVVTELGCGLVQGYAVGRPCAPTNFPLEATWP